MIGKCFLAGETVSDLCIGIDNVYNLLGVLMITILVLWFLLMVAIYGLGFRV